MIVTDEIKANDFYLGQAKPKRSRERHIPSKVQADTLFTFTSQLDFWISSRI